MTIIGSILALASYPLVWYVAKIDDAATITGFGTTHSTDTLEVTYKSSKLHWAVAAAGIVLLIVGITRLIGKYTDAWKRPTLIVGAIGVAGAVASAVLVDGDFKLGTGVYLALVGAIVALAGGALIAVAKK
ncbi:hypothetical protein GOEFS_039_00410 [Gordonia effusa NBRC 100432]|uniref:Uncharacterized protein n=1 Tax=Gordonia effusa NBRC 100432 TaxID=1077974 RepID=H0QYA6_9ACTN|nr:hypothetical protein GOEFS_039_00410 [Gordonia effusa NBRC 100432]